MDFKKIEWTDEYSVGHSELDRQHQHILHLINQIVERLNGGDLADSGLAKDVMSMLMRLYEVGQQHFYFEEIYLSRSDYPDIKAQQSSHSLYTDKVLQLMSEGVSDTENQKELIGFLLEWWNNHILVEDMAYKGHLKEE